MRKIPGKYMFSLLAGILMLVFCTSCAGKTVREAREKASAYLNTLASVKGISDTFTLSSRNPSDSKAAFLPFTVTSKTYGDDFTIWVSRDLKTVTDSYFTLTLKEAADKALTELVKTVSDGNDIKTTVRLNPAELSTADHGKVFDDLDDLYQTAGRNPLMTITVTEVRNASGETVRLSDDLKNTLLKALQEKGWSCTFYPDSSDTLWYEVYPDKLWETRRTGKDGGKMLERDEYIID